ncbi:helix-turn-helix domain-containing protein [Olleya sp. Bg11-27]|uniref:helix-turn-helix domain-containing protein n=1 Tax=Olleya sp. Bg11-27 TaxID=2058135 RepID=UPI000C308857|nr:helix-turn-helix domain-containing protein [Olleya sp. Bg11-27]AUC77065.1 AraC family transcriptional regulator [Olleya sp. Bg11-27]
MNTNHWNTKIQIVEQFDGSTKMLSENSMGIYIQSETNDALLVHFKPLNQKFNHKVFNTNAGVLLNFERDLIDEDDIEYALDVFALFNKFPEFYIKQKEQVLQIQQLINWLKGEFYSETTSYIMLKTLLKVLLLHLIRFQNADFLKQDLNQKRIFQFLELMETTFLYETTTEYYATQLGISSKRLNQVLKEKLNCTAKQIIQQRQITEAKRSLIKSDSTTKEIAFRLGFDSISSFSRFFKKNVGVSPSVFKTEH